MRIAFMLDMYGWKHCLLACLFFAPSTGAENTTNPASLMLLPESALPKYEANIDHAKMIRNNSGKVRKLGAKVYQQVCLNCHGDLKQAGSIPSSLRFASGKFQHGHDPYTMYQTITRGWRAMVPQVALTPREKYAAIHYIRDHYLQRQNPSQYFKVTNDYLNSLPKGTSEGPQPVKRYKWNEMDYGPFLNGTFEITSKEKREKPRKEPADYVDPEDNIAYKAIAIRLDGGPGGVSLGKAWAAFEHDTLRVAGVWSGQGFIDWRGINFDGRHVVRPRTVGEPLFQTADAPGWANPETGNFNDARLIGLDKFRYGPLPREWGHFKGIYQSGDKTVISYTVGNAAILEHHALASQGNFVRHLNIGKSSKDLIVRLGNEGVITKVAGSLAVKISHADGFVIAKIPASATPVKLAFSIGKKPAVEDPVPLDLSKLTRGGKSQWPEVIETKITRGANDGPFQWDVLAIPKNNPWKSRMRTSGVDFTPDGKSAIICCWDGDVWKVDGITDATATTLSWKRIAAGLYQPLGAKLVKGQIFVSCRNQIVCLHDLNGDGETDFYQNFNSDHQVTEHFHEFAMGLQADKEGNLYYAKSARHARTPLVPQHGTLIKVSADGSKTEILAKGFRAANGVCRNPDGTFFVTDQEGHWNPMNRINHVKPGDYFYGNMWGYGAPDDKSNSAMEQPLCWVDKRFDRSPAELLWIDSEKWGPLDGALLHLSYGHGRLEIVPHETIKGQIQGGMCRLPIPDLPTGTMRGRFHRQDGHLYICGMAAWGTSRSQEPGGFYRIRTTGKAAHLPVKLEAHPKGIDITFSDPIDSESLNQFNKQFQVRSWGYQRSAQYGSKRYNEKTHQVTAATLSADSKVLQLEIEDMAPVWQMSIRYQFKGQNGKHVSGEIQNTIHQLKTH